MVSYIRSDLEFILEQIQIAEAHSAGADLLDLMANASEPLGLRTVDGSFNNLIPGREDVGAADQSFPRELEVVWRPGDDGLSNYIQVSGVVTDSEPRTISNLIADQSADNPAAVAVAGEGAATENGSFVIENQAPDEGLSAPFNSWMTFFGQFFDHGLDLVAKGQSGIVFMPLQRDDPLYVEGSPTNFMILTRATNSPGDDGILGTADDVHEHTNLTTPWVDQNQTYSSHPSHQVFLRAYEIGADGAPHATGHLIEGQAGGMATWADLVQFAAQHLGIALDGDDVRNVPLLATDLYGNFIPGPNGLPQLVTSSGLVEGDLANPVDPTAVGAGITGHAFLEDINPAADPVDSQTGLVKDPSEYDTALLDDHYIAGDGRVNENIALTAVHHIFHSEHNRLVEHTKQVILETGDLAFIAEWQNPDGTWDGERLFQAAKFGTEMQYQHLVFEEFARTVQPAVNVFSGYDYDLDPDILAEFAHTVYRFGHSMLRETVDIIDESGNLTQLGLIEAFLNPRAFADLGDADTAAGALVKGSAYQVGSEIDEFLTGALRNNLLGLPLDLGALNIARARDTGVPSLNEARRQFFEDLGDTNLRPYDSWIDFANNITNQESLVNFIAAYGTHELILNATTMEEMRQAANDIVFGNSEIEFVPGTDIDFNLDRLNFLNGWGRWESDGEGRTTTGLDDVDFWIGGLAEAHEPFGGMLGSTFNFIFEQQMELLQNGDRFYYLLRTEGLNMLTELEGNSFSGMALRNTNTNDLPANIFARPGEFLNVDPDQQIEPDPDEGGIVPLVLRTNVDPADNFLQYTGGDHVVLLGSEENDILIASIGDDAVYGFGGDDDIEGGHGVDELLGGDGDDVITDLGGEGNFKGGDGNDAIHAGNGVDLVLAENGDDFVHGGEDETEVFGGQGDDIIYGGDGLSVLFGNEGDDWLEGGPDANFNFGDNATPLGIVEGGHDVIMVDGNGAGNEQQGEGGDDIHFASSGPDAILGGFGFDWVTYAHDPDGIEVDFEFIPFGQTNVPPSPENTLDEFDQVDAISGSGFADVIRGAALVEEEYVATFATFENASLIGGFTEFLGSFALENVQGDVLLGGAGGDSFMGRDGNDIIDGDLSLDVYLQWTDNTGATGRADSMLEIQSRVFAREINPGDIDIVRELVDNSNPDDFDTAIYNDIRANYSVVTVAGVTTVTHLVPDRFDDGSDRLTNIERLVFADTEIVLDGENAAPVGLPTISDVTPFVGDELTLDVSAITDADNVTAENPDGNILDRDYEITWEFTNDQDPVSLPEWQDVEDPLNGITLHQDTLEVFPILEDAFIRARVNYLDDNGTLETVFSAPTALVQPNVQPDPVNAATVGAIALDAATPEIGTPITVTATDLFDANNVTAENPTGAVTSPVVFVWQQLVGGIFEDIIDPVTGTITVGASFTPTDEQFGRPLRVRAEYTDEAGFQNALVTGQSSPTGGNAAPVAVDDAVTTDEDVPVTVDVAVNDTDVNGDPLTVTAVTDGANGTAVVNIDGDVVYTPDADFNGADSVIYTVEDGAGGSTTGTLDITVTPVNDAPVAVDDAAATGAETPVNLDVVANDTDVDGDALSVDVIVEVVGGTADVEADGTVTFTPDAGFAGDATVDYTVTDGVETAAATATITVAAANIAPVAVDDAATTAFNTPITVDVLANDTDLDGDTLSVDGIGTVVGGAAIVETDGTVTFTPDVDFVGDATVDYTVSDGNGGTDGGVLTVTVEAGNAAPVAVDDVATTDEDTPIDIDAVANDTDDDGDTLTIASIGAVVGGAAVVAADGAIAFTPEADFSGEATVEYTVTDGIDTDAGLVTITVDPVNDAPVAVDDTATTAEDTPVSVDVVANDTDADGDALSVDIINGVTGGTAVIEAGGAIVFTPDADFNGDATIDYTVTDGVETSAATATVTVTPVNDAPVAEDDTAETSEDTPVGTDVVDNDTDVDGDALSVLSIGTVTGGTAIIETDGTITFTPDAGFLGVATVEYVVTDGTLTDTAVASITVTSGVIEPLGPPPAATILGTEGNDRAIRGTAGDDVIDALAGVDRVLAGGGNDVVLGGEDADELRGNGGDDELRGEDGADILRGNAGDDTLWGGAGDGDQMEGGADVDTFVYGVGDGADTITDFTAGETLLLFGTSFTTAEEAAAAIVGGVLDLGDGDVLTILGDTVTAADIQLFGSSAAPALLTTAATPITLTVTSVNSAPVAAPVTVATDEDTATGDLSTAIRDLATDVDGDTLSVTAIDATGALGLVSLVDGAVFYDPNGQFEALSDGEFGEDSFVVTISDGAGGLVNTTVTVDIEGITDVAADPAPVSADPLGPIPDVTIFGLETADRAIRGTAGDDVIDGLGGGDRLLGGGGDDILLGGEGADELRGNGGADQLRGGEGADILRGNAGDDTLWGGAGDGDSMIGGADVDTFVFGVGDGADTIEDFEAGEMLVLIGTGFATAEEAAAAIVGGVLDLGNGDVLTINGDPVTAENIDLF